MKLELSRSSEEITEAALQITGSKSETNRLLILQALYPNVHIDNVSKSDDSEVLQKALKSSDKIIDIHHAGTAMRFLTAYFSAKNDAEVILTGSERMQQRPIGVLVDALRMVGADITYTKKSGFPPLKIKGKNLQKHKVTLKAGVSSQFISALLLIAPSLPNGLELTLEGNVTSRPYIEMTLALLKQVGVSGHFAENTITVHPLSAIQDAIVTVESDWSSASYFYSLVALSGPPAGQAGKKTIQLQSYKTESLQGDSALVGLYKALGVHTIYNPEAYSITLEKKKTHLPSVYQADLSNTPDIAQTIAVTCFGLGIGCKLTGLHTLKIKETDRLLALKIELEKLGGVVSISEDSLTISPSKEIHQSVAIDTYNDHRMAMAFAPLALKTSLIINNAEVVSKSFPTFWEDMRKVGVQVQEIY
ncbi:3-phosphoshikimate 1-carboxyvinyltransferase [Rasiella sp. SM2506]|uniref:3-phosphoshikimate 1-carboxyvinyltransferase n=1 Tax=Rasiella sp. SM2506 TaxID=3423914 RepID=UPI003D7B5111